MMFLVVLVIYLTVTVGFCVYTHVVLKTSEYNWALFDAVMAMTTFLVLVGWILVFLDVFGIFPVRAYLLNIF